MKFSQYLNEDKPVGKKNKELWLEYLQKNYKPDDNLFVSFVSVDKAGINPKSPYDTPIGVYAYPLKFAMTEKIPYRGQNKPVKIKIIKPTNDKELSDDISEKALENLLEIIKLKYNIKEHHIEKWSDEALIDTPMGKLWNITRELSRNSNNHSGTNMTSPTKWTKILIDLGFDYVVDNGTKVIHSNEPTQAVFLNPKSYKVIDEEFVDSEERFKHTKNPLLKLDKISEINWNETLILDALEDKKLWKYLKQKDRADFNALEATIKDGLKDLLEPLLKTNLFNLSEKSSKKLRQTDDSGIYLTDLAFRSGSWNILEKLLELDVPHASEEKYVEDYISDYREYIKALEFGLVTRKTERNNGPLFRYYIKGILNNELSLEDFLSHHPKLDWKYGTANEDVVISLIKDILTGYKAIFEPDTLKNFEKLLENYPVKNNQKEIAKAFDHISITKGIETILEDLVIAGLNPKVDSDLGKDSIFYKICEQGFHPERKLELIEFMIHQHWGTKTLIKAIEESDLKHKDQIVQLLEGK
jgi:hypothetical protein